jgi:hypothetical protein
MADTLTRIIEIDGTRADDSARTAPAVLSTEYPVPRGEFFEVLRHTPDAVNLERAPLPLLEQHNGHRLNIGVVEHLRVINGKLRGLVRFGHSARAKEIWQDVKDNVVRSLSIGYQIDDDIIQGNRLIATRWTPFEVSAVSLPADPTAGFFRSRGHKMSTETEDLATEATEDRPMSRRERREARAAEHEENRRLRAEEERVEIIQRMCTHFRIGEEHVRRLVAEGADVEQVIQAEMPGQGGQLRLALSLGAGFELALVLDGALLTALGPAQGLGGVGLVGLVDGVFVHLGAS